METQGARAGAQGKKKEDLFKAVMDSYGIRYQYQYKYQRNKPRPGFGKADFAVTTTAGLARVEIRSQDVPGSADRKNHAEIYDFWEGFV